MSKEAHKNWFLQHPFLTGASILLVFIVLALIGSNHSENTLKQENNNLPQINQNSEKQSDAMSQELDSGSDHWASTTKDGMTISIDSYKFEKLGPDYGIISELSFTLENQGSARIYPDLVLQVRDEDSSGQDTPQKRIPLSVWLDEGYSLRKTVSTSLTVPRMGKLKTITLSAVEFYDSPLVTTNLENVNLSLSS